MIGSQIICAVGLLFYISSALTAEVTNASNYIAGGRQAVPGQFPFIVSLRSRTNQHRCGGAIISNRWVISAVTCTIGTFANPVQTIAVVGAHTLYDGTPHNVDRIINHPQFHAELRRNDISLLRIVGAIQFNQRIQSLRLPKTDFTEQRPILQLWNAGWGKTREPGQLAPILQLQQGMTTTRSHCRQSLRAMQLGRMVHETSICTMSPNGQGNCRGDSGGPLINEEGVCVAIVSFTIGCGTQFPDVFTRVFPFLRFIYENTGVLPQ